LDEIKRLTKRLREQQKVMSEIFEIVDQLTPNQKKLVSKNSDEFLADVMDAVAGKIPSIERAKVGKLGPKYTFPEMRKAKFGDLAEGSPMTVEQKQIRHWAHMLDESMSDKGISENWTTGGSDFVQTARELGFDGRQTSQIASEVFGKIADALDINGVQCDVVGFGPVSKFKIIDIPVEGEAYEEEYGETGLNGEGRYDYETNWEITNTDYDRNVVLEALSEIGLSAKLQDINDVKCVWNDDGSGTADITGQLLVKDKDMFKNWIQSNI